MEILDVVPTSLDVLMDDIRGDGANLDQTIVLDKYGIAGKVSVYNRWRGCLVKVTGNKQNYDG